MALKWRYVLQYICFRVLPILLLMVCLSGLLICASATNGNRAESTAIGVVCVSAVAAVILYWFGNIVHFLCMIERQRKQYQTDFSNINAITVARWSRWVICSENWLIQPGKIALYRAHIQTASITETAEKGGIRYRVNLKTKTGKRYTLKFSNETIARTIRVWARA